MTTNAQGPGITESAGAALLSEPGGVNIQLGLTVGTQSAKWHQKPSSKKYHYGL